MALEWIELACGPLTMSFDPDSGSLRYVRLGESEVVRNLYVAVRDRNWDTIAPHVSNLQREQRDEGSFRLTFDVTCREREVDFFWQGTLTGETDGTVCYTMEGLARSSFWRNRIGFCLLHPIRECAGQPCRVERTDGTLSEETFPYDITPHQPFREMKAISHPVNPVLWAEVRFEGDTFEMEDQRNWTDASYKTYCTPLSIPFPQEVEAGTRVFQSVTIRLQGEVPEGGSNALERDAPVVLTIDNSRSLPLPRIGLGCASHGKVLTKRELEHLQSLHLSHLRVDLTLSQPEYREQLAQATTEAGVLGVALEMALFLSDEAEAELQALVAELERLQPNIASWLIFHTQEKSTSEPWIHLARRYLTAYQPEAKIGAGTNAYFAELNRGRPPVSALDFVSFSVNPQVHLFDDATLMENLEAQSWAVRSARAYCGDLPVRVSPVTLKPRFNPNATGPEPLPPLGELPSQVDARQITDFGACWTLGSLKYLCESGVQSLTYYETTGWRGVMETEASSPLPAKFPSVPGAVFPLFQVFADLGEFVGGSVLPVTSSAPLRVEAMAVQHGSRTAVLLANLTNKPQRVQLSLLGKDVLTIELPAYGYRCT